jgi:DNA-binding CsgD family transcriptional regulator
LTRLVRPAALSQAATAQVIGRGLGEPADDSFVAACFHATGGIPFLVQELVRALAADGVRPTPESATRVNEFGPRTVARATLLRLSALAPAAAELARAVGVLGPDATLRRAGALAGLEQADAIEARDALAAANVFKPSATLEFVHPIIRTSIYEDLSPGQRSAFHDRAAALLAQQGAGRDTVAMHLLQTEPAGRAEVVEQLRAAAASAMARGTPEYAVACLQRALHEGPDVDLRLSLLHELGVAEKLLRQPSAAEHLEQAMRLAADPVERARAAHDLAETLVYGAHWDAGVAVIEAALRDLGDRDDDLALRLETMRAATSAYDSRHVDQFDSRVPTLRAAIEQGGRSARALSLLMAAIEAIRGDRLDEIPALLERGLDGGRFLADEGPEAWAIPQGCMALIILDELDAAAGIIDQVNEDARASGSVYGFAVAGAIGAWIHARRGDLVNAQADARSSYGACTEHDLLFGLPTALFTAIDAMVERPELADLAATADALELGPDFGATLSGAYVLEARGRMDLVRGDTDRAVANLRACGSIRETLHAHNPNESSWRSALALALASEDRTEAAALAAAELADARRAGLGRGIGVALHTAGLLDGAADGIDLLRQAVDILERSPARLEHARALVDLGAALRRANHRASARDALRPALDMATRCGATRLADRARAELRASGGRAARQVGTGLAALTPSELRVAGMAADGMSNPQIGQALFVSRNTIETHLRHVFQKLGVRSRDDLRRHLETADASA